MFQTRSNFINHKIHQMFSHQLLLTEGNRLQDCSQHFTPKIWIYISDFFLSLMNLVSQEATSRKGYEIEKSLRTLMCLIGDPRILLLRYCLLSLPGWKEKYEDITFTSQLYCWLTFLKFSQVGRMPAGCPMISAAKKPEVHEIPEQRKLLANPKLPTLPSCFPPRVGRGQAGIIIWCNK